MEHFELTPDFQGPIEKARYHLQIARDALAGMNLLPAREIAITLCIDLRDLANLESKLEREQKRREQEHKRGAPPVACQYSAELQGVA